GAASPGGTPAVRRPAAARRSCRRARLRRDRAADGAAVPQGGATAPLRQAQPRRDRALLAAAARVPDRAGRVVAVGWPPCRRPGHPAVAPGDDAPARVRAVRARRRRSALLHLAAARPAAAP